MKGGGKGEQVCMRACVRVCARTCVCVIIGCWPLIHEQVSAVSVCIFNSFGLWQQIQGCNFMFYRSSESL